MISDETFPQELLIDEEENDIFHSISAACSFENINSYISTETSNNYEDSLIDSSTIGLLIHSSAKDFERMTQDKSSQKKHPEISFKSIDDSAHKVKIPPPTAPIKKRKSYSCHDLQLRKNSSNNYDHVESKVKKLIQNLAPDDKRKSFARTKSMVS